MSTDPTHHALTLAIPQAVYESLMKVAEKSGQNPESLATHWLTSAVQQCEEDPLEQFIGAFSSNIPDWLDRHDAYLGQTLLDPDSNHES